MALSCHPHQFSPIMSPGFTWETGHNLKYAQPSAHCSYLSASPLLTRLPTITGTPRPTHTTKPEGLVGGRQIG